MSAKTLKTVKGITSIIIAIALNLIPTLIAMVFVGNGIAKAFYHLFGENYHSNIPLVLLTVFVWLAIIIPSYLLYGKFYFKTVEKHNCKGWLYTPLY